MMILRNLRFNITTLVATLCICFGFNASAAYNHADSSKLASGHWVKIKVTETGIHAITASDASSWGFSDLSKVHVFGYGGAPISEKLSASIPDDLPQVPIIRSSDRILFYAQGPTTWNAQSGDVNFVQVQHPYATAGYYFVTDDSRYSDVTPEKATNAASGTTVNTFTERVYHEEETVNPGETGRILLGEDFRYTKSQSFKFSLTGYVSGTPVNVLTEFASKTANGNGKVTFQQNGTAVASSASDEISNVTDVQHQHYFMAHTTKTFTPTSSDLTWNITYSSSGTLYLARLNYVTVNYQRSLALNNGIIAWGQYNGSQNINYQVSGCSESTHIWDVTTNYKPVAMNATVNGGTASFSPIASGNREYVAFNESASFPSPTKDSEVSNQNIHGSETPDLIIIAPSDYLTQANRVAAMHESVDSMRVLVVDQKLVFNEYSSGTPDAMAYRMLCKNFYDKGADAKGHKLGYLLLFGGGSYDNRQLTTAVQAASYPMLLTWQSETSNDENISYTSDDPFGMLSDGDGPTFENYDIDIAVGRFPVKSTTEAKTAVDKLIKYVTTPNNGSWKNNTMDLADDENNGIHMEQAEAAIKTAMSYGGKDFVFNRVYMDAFTATSQGAARYYPDARSKMFRLLNEGVLWWNYTGHASPNGWTGESQLTHQDIEESLFYKHLPILYAATCEFTRFDALSVSGGENMFLNSNGGAIALICPARLVYIEQNGRLHNFVARYVFRKDADGNSLRLGDILRLGKNEYRKNTSSGSESNNQRYMLFGDPAMRPAAPTYKAVIETINGQAVSDSNMPVFQARQTLTFTGHVNDAKGNKDTKFNGPIVATLYDCEESVETHGYGDGKKFVYYDRPNKLAVKVDTVKNGEFTFKVTVPSEIVATFENYSPSLINLYAYDNSVTNSNTYNGGSKEAMGSNDQFYIYGYDESEQADTIGPTINYFVLNNTEFNDGDNVNESPLVMASVSDKSGINISTSGIGHNMILTLDETKTYDDVSAYFTPATTDDGTGSAGTISYQLSDLDAGNHTLRLRVWDVFNNSSSQTINFNVITGLKPELYDVYCTPNPASTDATFYVKHNRPDATVTIGIDVYDLLGRKIWTTTQTGRSDATTSFPVTWDLTNTSGNRVPRGIYIYRARISTDGVQEATKAKKIAVTAQ